MCIRDSYDIVWEKQGDDEQGTGVFNGDVGEIIRIFPQQECMVIRFDAVSYTHLTTMTELGDAVGIDVGAAVVVVLH